MPVAIRARLTTLERLPEDAWEAERALESAREVFALLKTTEARHVTRGLRDPSFGFVAAQEELGGLRRCFASRVRELARSKGFVEATRRELLTMAVLAEQAPLSTAADLEAIRAGRTQQRLAEAV
jgi:hypothetical protein